MKVLQVNCVYNKGSTGKIVYDLHSRPENTALQSVVCYGRGQKSSDKQVIKTCGELYAKANNLLSRFTGIMYGGCFFSTNRLISIIKREQPDIVHLHCINGYFVNIYRLIAFLKTHKIKTVLTLHAEFMHTANCGHALDCEKWKTGCGNCPRLRQETKSLFWDRTHTSWKRMYKAFEGFDTLTVVSVSPWLMERAKQSPILADKKHTVILNGLDTNLFRPYDTAGLKAAHGITHQKILFHATPSFNDDPQNIKGGHYLLKLAKALEGEPVKLFVAGNYDPALRVPKNVVLLGRITDQKKLAQYYAMADATVLTSRRETFSMVVAESLCCGTPVVGFEAGAPEQIALKEYSTFVPFGDVDALKAAVDNILQQYIAPSDLSEKAAVFYNRKNMITKYTEIYHSII